MKYGRRLTSVLHTGVCSNSSSGRFIAGTHCTDGWQDRRDSLGSVPKGQHIYLSSLRTNSTPSALYSYTAQTKMCLALSPRSVYTFKADIIKQSGNFSFDSSEALHPSKQVNPLKPELNPICYLLALLRAHHFLHVSRIRVKSLTLR